MSNWVWPFRNSRIACASHTFSKSVCLILQQCTWLTYNKSRPAAELFGISILASVNHSNGALQIDCGRSAEVEGSIGQICNRRLNEPPAIIQLQGPIGRDSLADGREWR
jgi:hypothetical protein